MKRKLIFATGNAGKMREIREILGDMDAEICSMKEAGIETEVEENGASFEENALLKARAAAARAAVRYPDAVVLADDSGLEVDYLHKEPGIYSARYLGEDTPYAVKCQSLLDRLDGVPQEKRTARFVCVIAAVLPDGRTITTRGVVEGRIADGRRGEGGFGYDPIFHVPAYGCTMAELSEEQKNRISHRGMALSEMKTRLLAEAKNADPYEGGYR